MIYRVELTRKAMREIEANYEWLAERAPFTAQRWKENLQVAILQLARDPHKHPEAPEAERVGFDLRQMVVGRIKTGYRVLFEIVGDTVHVLRVRHVRQDDLEPDNI